MNTLEAPFIGINRHRIGIDGEGVTTLAAFHGCPLRCRYCLNPGCLDAEATVRHYTPESLYQALLIDNLYFVATGGGVCFGGGEPLLRPDFLRRFHELCEGRWKITLETSLNVAPTVLQKVHPIVSHYIIDIKDANDDIYQAYTGKSNRRVWENLRWLAEHADPTTVTIRVPLIPEFNSEKDIERSMARVRELGFTQIDRLTYKT
ncbi:MAG: radical SAM protein [Bacteroidales bacterium]|nr:radical SAM protein [Bacteroidales bacterium]